MPTFVRRFLSPALPPRIVTIGGGTGTFALLSGLRQFPCYLTAVVTMADSGGSSGRLRDELGVLPPGDLRQALVALSESPQLMRDLFMYRFTNGDLKGHNFGNIFVSAMEKLTGDIGQASKSIAQLLQVRGQVLPVTLSDSQLAVELEDGQIITSEHLIDEPEHDGNLRIARAFLQPEATINPDVTEAIEETDLVVIGPGDLYTSLVPNLLVKGVPEALRSSRAKIVYVCNLMTKFGQTQQMSAKDHADVIEHYLGPGVLDVVLINSQRPAEDLLDKYEELHQMVVASESAFDAVNYQVVFAPLMAQEVTSTQAADVLKRSLIRHDPTLLAEAILGLL